VFPWENLPTNAQGFDLGCGSGRWAGKVATRVGRLHCIDASAEALAVARRNLTACENIDFHLASVEEIPLADASMDFGYSLGVLHHVPDATRGIQSCVEKLKSGAPFLIYLYYAFDNRPMWFKAAWKVSDLCRRAICKLPFGAKKVIAEIIAATVYFPLARAAGLVEKAGVDVDVLPLSTYRRHSFYTMRTDALDRFGTRLEQRFTKDRIKEMMNSAGLDRIVFSDGNPYWCAVGFKKG
jgi:ubiquinone/menaquinone biosynthesis C-methylase UbiE